MYKQIYLFYAFIIIQFLPGCLDIPEKILMPRWNVDLNVPLTNQTYTLDDFIKRNNYINIDTADAWTYVISSDKYQQSISIAEFIRATDTSGVNKIVPTDNVTQHYFLQFPDSAKIQSAVFSQGKMRIVAHNPNALGPARLHLRFPGMKAPNSNSMLELEMSIPARGFTIEERDLPGYIYEEPFNQDTAHVGQFWVQAIGSSELPSLGNISFDCFTSDFVFRTIHGYLHRRSLGHKEQSFSTGDDASGYRNKIKIKEASLNLSGEYLSFINDPFAVRIRNLMVLGKRNDGATYPLQLNNGGTTIDFINKSFNKIYTQENSNVLSFFEFFPDSILISADYYMNDDNDPAYKTAASTDSIRFTSLFNMKTIVAIKQSTITDNSEVKIEPEDRGSISHGNIANISLQIENSIPMDVWVKVTLADMFNNPLFVVTSTTENGMDSIHVQAANINSIGEVTSPSVTSMNITLNNEQIKNLSQSYNALLSVTVQTAGHKDPNPFLFPIRATDWLRIKSSGAIQFRIGKDE